MSPRRLRLAPEFGCWPLWDDRTGDNLDPRELGLPADLVARLIAWDNRFQANFDTAYPPDSRFPDQAAEAAWIDEGHGLLAALQAVWGAGAIRGRPAADD